MILHILLDDKFGDYTIMQFEKCAPQNNIYLIPKEHNVLNYIKLVSQNIILLNEKDIIEFIDKNFKSFSSIVFHGLNEPYKWEIIKKYSNTNIKLHWIFWGTDGYMLPHLRKGLYSKQTLTTKLQLSKTNYFSFYFFNNGGRTFNFYNKLYKLKNRHNHFLKDLELAIKSISSVSAIPTDYDKLQKFLKINYPNFKYPIGSIESILCSQIENNNKLGSKILIGNSASIENNHLDVLIQLSKITKKTELIIPLNYGESIKGYKKVIKEYLNKNFEKYEVIDEFLPRQEYNNKLQTCSAAIMGHNKQHAWGNIQTLLYMGIKVFLSLKNPLYKYCLDLGLNIYSLNELSANELLVPLSMEEKKHNQKILHKHFGSEQVLIDTKKLANYLLMH